MPKPQPEAANRKNAILLRLAADPRQLAAKSSALPTNPQARLAMLLGEIDEVVLPRVLHVTSGDPDAARLTAHLIVSHRRLIGIETQDRPKSLADTGRKAEPGAQALMFAARLVEIAEWRGDLSLSVSHRAAPPSHAEIACSVTALRQALDLPPSESACDRLQRLVEAQAVARLHWSGKSPQAQFSGTSAWRVTLQTIAYNYLKMHNHSKTDTHTGPLRTSLLRTEGLLIPIGTDLAIVMASLDRQGFAAVLPRQTGFDLIAAWQSRG